MDIELVQDYGDKLQLLHYVAIEGVIIWPERRRGEVVNEAPHD